MTKVKASVYNGGHVNTFHNLITGVRDSCIEVSGLWNWTLTFHLFESESHLFAVHPTRALQAHELPDDSISALDISL